MEALDRPITVNWNNFMLEEALQELSTKMDQNLFIDKKSLFFLNGSELDYHDGLTGAGFKFKNPNVKGSCGCGESFSV